MFQNIDAERARLAMKRCDLANQLGVSRSTLRSWINGSTNIPCSALIDMSKMFNVSVDYLLGLEVNTKN